MTHIAMMTSEPQRLRALERANQVRLARAELKRQIAQGRRSAAEIILDSPKEARSWAVRDLLLSQRRWGAKRCRKLLAELQIPERKEIGKLTERQRNILAGRLDVPVTRKVEVSNGVDLIAREIMFAKQRREMDRKLAPEVQPVASEETELAPEETDLVSEERELAPV